MVDHDGREERTSSSCKMILFFMITLLPLSTGVAGGSKIAMEGCKDECGGIKIPYPFGIGPNCSYSSVYNIICNESMVPIYDNDFPVLGISFVDHSLRILSQASYECPGDPVRVPHKTNLTTVRFTVSSTMNKFVAIGCDTQAMVGGQKLDGGLYFYAGCMSTCLPSMEGMEDGICLGDGCCETPIPKGLTKVTSSVWSNFNHTNVPSNPCSAAFLVENNNFTFSSASLSYGESVLKDLKVPVVFDWSIINGECSCGLNANCTIKANDTEGFRCTCKECHEGNPYLPQGCEGIVDCELEADQGRNCSPGLYWDGEAGSCTYDVTIPIAMCFALIILLVGGYLLHWRHSEKKLSELREKFFHQNGGFILSQKLKDHGISIQKFKIFTEEELENATNQFTESSIIGIGGFGMVYRGTLANGDIVAIKRSLKVDPNQVEHFINEVLALSEINNRNVVKLFGCCLETKVPLLVYEFISNGTLYEHLHDEEKASRLSWSFRLSVAEAVASVLSYLHTTIAVPIIHRDMKSMNILLDENYTAKVSDFGASKLVPADEDQIATIVLGTRGYLDPEYMQTGQLTEKSDVYSFGVVLVELLTSKKVVCNERPENERGLAMLFLSKMKEERLFDIVDERIKGEETLHQIMKVASLAKRCLRLKGEERPSTKEVAMELEGIRTEGNQQWFGGIADEDGLEECQYLLIQALEESEGLSSSTDEVYGSNGGNLMLLGDGR